MMCTIIMLFYDCYVEDDRPSRIDLTNHVIPSVANNWKGLGEMLLDTNLVDSGYLEAIEAENPGNLAECCRQMFIKWLKTDNDASWKKLIIELQRPGVQLNALAKEINRKLQKGKVALHVASSYQQITNNPMQIDNSYSYT